MDIKTYYRTENERLRKENLKLKLEIKKITSRHDINLDRIREKIYPLIDFSITHPTMIKLIDLYNQIPFMKSDYWR
jgi:hypothetical protein